VQNQAKSKHSRFSDIRARLAVSIPSDIVFLLVVVVVMITAGLSMCYSTTFVSQQVAHATLIKQLQFLALGLVLSVTLGVLARFFFTEQRDIWFIIIGLFWIISLGLMALVLVPGFGVKVNGAVRWIDVAGFRFQPSELAKVALILFSATAFDQLKNDNSSRLRWFLLGSYILLQFLALKQNDFGTIMLLHFGLLVVMWLGDRPFVSLNKGFFTSISFLSLFPVLLLVASYLFFPFRRSRFQAMWCKLTGDSITTVLSDADQLRNGILALGDGGVFGLGAGLSKQKYFYLPAADNDFVFAIIGEEFGMVGALLVLFLFLLFAFFGLRITAKAGSSQGKMIAGGATCMIVGQALINIGGIIGATPLTGKPLPFFSSGGSSMVASVLLAACIVIVAIFDSEQNSAVRRQDALTVIRGRAVEDADYLYDRAVQRNRRRDQPAQERLLVQNLSKVTQSTARNKVGERKPRRVSQSAAHDNLMVERSRSLAAQADWSTSRSAQSGRGQTARQDAVLNHVGEFTSSFTRRSS